MGLFKDLKGMTGDLKDIQEMAKDVEKPSLKDGLSQMKGALADVKDQQALVQEVSAGGHQGTATIKALTATGREINHMPEMKVDLTVDGNEVSVTQPVSPALIGSMQPGGEIPVTYIKDDPSKLVLGHIKS